MLATRQTVSNTIPEFRGRYRATTTLDHYKLQRPIIRIVSDKKVDTAVSSTYPQRLPWVPSHVLRPLQDVHLPRYAPKTTLSFLRWWMWPLRTAMTGSVGPLFLLPEFQSRMLRWQLAKLHSSYHTWRGYLHLILAPPPSKLDIHLPTARYLEDADRDRIILSIHKCII